ncbi:hypothetical protein JCM8547_001416 [Rhodosporidiobolus lusitaniae]
MVHFVSSVLVASTFLSTVAPGALAAPARPLPLREGKQAGLLKSAGDVVKKDHSRWSHRATKDSSYGYPTERERRLFERRSFSSEPDHLLDLEIESQFLKREEKRAIWLNKSADVDDSNLGVLLDADIAGLEIHLKRRDEQAFKTGKAGRKQLKKIKGGKKGNKTSLKKAVASKTAFTPAQSAVPLVDIDAKVLLGNQKRELLERGLATAGVPGFVEVATPLFNSTLARTIAGLVFTTNPDPSPNAASSFVLGTSETQSTQFYLTNAANPDPLTPKELNVVNIRVPILDSKKLVSTDYCASFDLTPPSPLELMPCGETQGYSQNFAYTSATGELQPLYASTPAPMALVATPPSANSTKPATSGTQANSFAAETSDEEEQDQEEEANVTDIGLYFVPASAYYDAPKLVNSLVQQLDNSTTDSRDSTATATPSALLPANTTTSLTSVSSTSTSTSTTLSSTTTSRFASHTSSSSPVPTVLPTTHRAMATSTSVSSTHSSSSNASSPSTASSASTATVHKLAVSSTSSHSSSSASEAPLSTWTITASSSASASTATPSPSSTLAASSAPSAVSSNSSSSSAATASPTVTLQNPGRMVRRGRRYLGRW